MNVFKWLAIFAIAFLAAWILIFTFNQEPFKASVPAQILVYKTPPVPIYIYLTGAFSAGLIVGLWIAVYNFITQKAKLTRTSKKLHSIEHEYSQVTAELENCRTDLTSLRTELAALKEEKFRAQAESKELKGTDDVQG